MTTRIAQFSIAARPRVAAALALAVGASDASAQQWTFLDGPAFGYRTAAFDFVRGRLVWLGSDGVTWELAGDRLLHRVVEGASPPPRTFGAMVYDFGGARSFLFGGLGVDAALLGDTWTWDGTRWTQLLGGPQPPPRIDAAITYDFARQRVLLYGGQQLGVGQLQDTWEHDGTQWIARTPATVPGPNSPVMTYDLLRAVAVMVTHQGFAGSPVVTWEWNGTDWTQRATSGPSSNGSESMAFDLARGRTVLFGGVGTTGVWEWDGTSWQGFPVANAPSRLNPALLFDPSRGRVIAVGGTSFRVVGGSTQSGSVHTDTWEWDGATLRQVRPDLRPHWRNGHVWITDAARGEIVLFGGFGAQAALGDTWTWDGAAWTRRLPTTQPAPRHRASGCQDLVRSLVLLFGGNSGGTIRNDLWGWNGVDWAQLDQGSGPSARIGAALAADPVRGVVVLFGGAQDGQFASLRNDTWEWNGTAWTQRAPAAAPSPREGSAMEFDAARGRVLLFGGRVGATANDQLADAWEYDGTNWTRLQLPGAPPALLEPALVHDPAQARTLLTGTVITGATSVVELWALGGGAWSRLQRDPGLLLGGPLAMDPRRQRVVGNAGQVIAEWSTTPAQVQSIGSGCGTTVPLLAAHSRPRVGDAGFGFETRVGTSQPVFFALGDAPAGVPLGGGCTLLLGGNAVAVLATPGVFGVAEVVVPIPANVALRGLTVFAQAAVLDPAAPGFRMTQALRVLVGD